MKVCPEAELFCNDDYTPRKDLPLTEDPIVGWPDHVEIRGPKHLKELIIGLNQDGKKADEIAYHVPCSVQYIYQVLKEHKKALSVQALIVGLHR